MHRVRLQGHALVEVVLEPRMELEDAGDVAAGLRGQRDGKTLAGTTPAAAAAAARREK